MCDRKFTGAFKDHKDDPEHKVRETTLPFFLIPPSLDGTNVITIGEWGCMRATIFIVLDLTSTSFEQSFSNYYKCYRP